MTRHATRGGRSGPAGQPPPAAEQFAGGGAPVPWQPPGRCLYRRLLREVIDPELGVNIIDLGLVYDVRVADGLARVRMTMTTPGCPLGAYFDDAIRDALSGAPGVDRTEVRIVWDPPWRPAMMSDEARARLGWLR